MLGSTSKGSNDYCTKITREEDDPSYLKILGKIVGLNPIIYDDLFDDVLRGLRVLFQGMGLGPSVGLRTHIFILYIMICKT